MLERNWDQLVLESIVTVWPENTVFQMPFSRQVYFDTKYLRDPDLDSDALIWEDDYSHDWQDY